MNADVKKFIAFKVNTLARVSSGEITRRMANTLIQPELDRCIHASYLTKQDFIKEVLTSEYPPNVS